MMMKNYFCGITFIVWHLAIIKDVVTECSLDLTHAAALRTGVRTLIRAEGPLDLTRGLSVIIKCNRNYEYNDDSTEKTYTCNNDIIEPSQEVCKISKLTRCKKTRRGTEYFGTRSTTASNIPCQRWDSDSPHQTDTTYVRNGNFPHDGSVRGAINYCRNPDNSQDGPWCYTTSDNKERESCGISNCYPELARCRNTRLGTEYFGTQSTTQRGVTCQLWQVNTPHAVSEQIRHSSFRYEKSKLLASNYCRNPNNRSNGPWCYTTNSATEWDYCGIPFCHPELTECKTTNEGQEYIGTISTSASGKTCQRWDSDNPHENHYLQDDFFPNDGGLTGAQNFCRNPDREPYGPWCYTTTRGAPFEFCSVRRCPRPTDLDYNRCKITGPGREYRGTQSITVNRNACQRWDTLSPHIHTFTWNSAFPYDTIGLGFRTANDFCRNPDNSPAGPWCFTTDPNTRREDCGIPQCETTEAPTENPVTAVTTSGCRVPAIENGQSDRVVSSRITPGLLVYYWCDDGYTFVNYAKGHDDMYTSCTGNNVFLPEIQNCAELFCTLDSLDNYINVVPMKSPGSHVLYNEVVNFVCSSGYVFSDGKSVNSLTCIKHQTFEPNYPACYVNTDTTVATPARRSEIYLPNRMDLHFLTAFLIGLFGGYVVIVLLFFCREHTKKHPKKNLPETSTIAKSALSIKGLSAIDIHTFDSRLSVRNEVPSGSTSSSISITPATLQPNVGSSANLTQQQT